jgi:hypothetical protein
MFLFYLMMLPQLQELQTILFICGLFNDAVSGSDYIASNYGMIHE